MRLCVAHASDEYPGWLRFGLPRAAFRRLSAASRSKRNPRDQEQMLGLARAAFGPDSRVVRAHEIEPRLLADASEIVLLWPDGNGYGWGRVERRVFARKAPSCAVVVLNGRRRRFTLSRWLRVGYLVRRILERFWVAEIAFSLLFLLVSPCLVVWDLATGRR